MSADRSSPAAIVTGSSTGIGRAIAVELARSGWDVVIHGLEPDEAARTASLAADAGARTATITGDIGDPGTAGRLVATAQDAFGRLDGVVSNAGTGMTRAFTELQDPDWETVLGTHLLGAARLLRAAAGPLRDARGAAVNISSLAAVRGIPGRSGYGAAKAGLEGLTMQLACEWAPDGVRVNAIAPGTILTPLVERNFAAGLLDADRVLERTPMGRFGKPEEIAAVARFLLSEDSSYITGQTIRVDGGWSAWGGWQ